LRQSTQTNKQNKENLTLKMDP